MKNHHKLLSYSTSAIAFILLHDAQAQAVYTDIDPDIVLDEDFDAAGVDMDNNGSFDFAFLNVSYTSQGATWNYSLIQKIWVGAYGTSANQIAGTSSTFILHKYYPYALEFGNSIDDAVSFQNAGYQRMAYRIFITYQTWEGDTLENSAAGGHWFPETLNHYLGVHFVDEDYNYHYGWIRCDVLDEGRTLIIKDYAYETKCDVGILAGDMIGDTSVNIENIISLDANAYAFENNIYVDVKDLNEKTEVYIYSISGDLIYSKILLELNTIIPFTLPKGVYLVNIVSKNGQYQKKLFIN